MTVPFLYPGVAQLVARVVWDHQAAGSNPVTRTKNPLGSMILEDFYYFFVYCGAIFTCIQCACRKVNLMYEEN